MKKIKTKKLTKNHQPKPQSNDFYKKIIILSIIFASLSYIFNIKNIDFFAEISDAGKGLLGKTQLINQMDNIKDDSTTWPLAYVTNWGKVTDYQKAKATDWENLEDDYKTAFPGKILSDFQKYKFVSPYNIWDMISNPDEREKVVFLKRLITTSWTASYSCGSNDCKWWIPDSGTHAGVDIVTSPGTPVYSIANGIIIEKKSDPKGFGNYYIIATNFDGEIVATFYAHLKSFVDGFKEGDIIKKGDIIGYVGSSGNSTATHLHIQVNKLGKAEDIKSIDIAKQLWQGWFDNIDGLKQKTYDPLAFIENKLKIVNDALTVNTSDTSANTNIAGNTTTSISTNITENNPQSAIEKDFRIKEISFSKIDNKLLIGDTISANIKTEGAKGSITITTNNAVLTPNKYILSPNDNNNYEVSVQATDVGNGQIIFSDGENIENKYFTVYEKGVEIYGLKIDGSDTIYSSTPTEFVIYPTDNFDNKIDSSLQGKFKVLLTNKSTQESTTISEFENDEKTSLIKIKVQAPNSNSDYQIKVIFDGKNKSFVSQKTVKSEIFADYSKNDSFGLGMQYLNENQIVQGSEGNLMPNNNITRAELITILMRYKYGDNIEQFKQDMNDYIISKGRFFKDISGKEWYAPYLFKGFVSGVIQGDNGYAMAMSETTKSQLIAIYGRFFNISNYEIFTSWLDVSEDQDGWFKKYADAAKKYNLYPFEDKSYFNGTEIVTRLLAFESLYRYIKYKPENVVVYNNTSTDNSSTNDTSNQNNNSTTNNQGDSNANGNNGIMDTLNSLLN